MDSSSLLGMHVIIKQAVSWNKNDQTKLKGYSVISRKRSFREAGLWFNKSRLLWRSLGCSVVTILFGHQERHTFSVRTKHETVKWILILADTTGQLVLWRFRVSEFRFPVILEAVVKIHSADKLLHLDTVKRIPTDWTMDYRRWGALVEQRGGNINDDGDRDSDFFFICHRCNGTDEMNRRTPLQVAVIIHAETTFTATEKRWHLKPFHMHCFKILKDKELLRLSDFMSIFYGAATMVSRYDEPKCTEHCTSQTLSRYGPVYCICQTRRPYLDIN